MPRDDRICRECGDEHHWWQRCDTFYDRADDGDDDA